MSEPISHVLGELSGYLDRTLSPAEVKRIDTHLKGCLSCQRHFTQLRALRQMLKSGPTYTPTESFYQGVLHRIAKPESNFKWSWNISAKTFASACGILLIVWVTHVARKEKAALLFSPADTRQEAAKNKPEEIAIAGKKGDAQGAPQAALPSLNMPVPAQEEDQKQMSDKDRITHTPAEQAPQPLRERSDIVHQARDMNGATGQNSFSESRRFLKAAAKTSQMNESANAEKPAEGNLDALSASVQEPALHQWKGMDSGIIDSRTVIIESLDAWQTLWRTHSAPSPSPVPDIDFTRYAVVGVFAGQKPSGGYSMDIVVIRQTPGALIVVYRETVPPPETTQLTVLTQPYHLQVIRKTNLLVQFKKL